MFLRLKLLTTTLASGAVLMLVLCLGSQNLSNRKPIQLGLAKTAPLPSGFVIGVSIVLGVISGGSTAALIIPEPPQYK